MNAPITSNPRWQSSFVDDTRQGFWIVEDDRYGEGRFWLDFPTKEQAEYAVLILEAGGVDWSEDADYAADLVYEMCTPVACSSCGKQTFSGEVDPGGRGVECQP